MISLYPCALCFPGPWLPWLPWRRVVAMADGHDLAMPNAALDQREAAGRNRSATCVRCASLKPSQTQNAHVRVRLPGCIHLKQGRLPAWSDPGSTLAATSPYDTTEESGKDPHLQHRVTQIACVCVWPGICLYFAASTAAQRPLCSGPLAAHRPDDAQGRVVSR